jgi:predicted RNase H-like HicB family nuclease
VEEYLETGRLAMKFAVIIEKAGSSYGAYVPDLPGCVAAGDSPDEVTALIRKGIKLHVDAMRADGEMIPEPTTQVRELEIA